MLIADQASKLTASTNKKTIRKNSKFKINQQHKDSQLRSKFVLDS
jgi:hypothetical protein